MNEIIATIIVCAAIVLFFIIYYRCTKLRDNGSPINEARDNNRKSGDINRQANRTIEKLRAENREATRLNGDIKQDNSTARDIIAEVRKQKLD